MVAVKNVLNFMFRISVWNILLFFDKFFINIIIFFIVFVDFMILSCRIDVIIIKDIGRAVKNFIMDDFNIILNEVLKYIIVIKVVVIYLISFVIFVVFFVKMRRNKISRIGKIFKNKFILLLIFFLLFYRFYF